MRQAVRKANRGQVSRTVSIPAPVGGWNARDSMANMPASDAVTLKNFFPATTECRLRYGYSQYATGLPAAVETLMDYEGGSVSKFFAISSTSIYDITAGGAVGAPVKTGLTNAHWQHCNFATPGGNFLVLANAVDAVLNFDGTNWTNPAITGVTPANLNNPMAFKNRLWFVEKNTLKAWYLPTQAIAGAAAAVDMSSVAQLGGYLVAHAAWTIDAGYGMDDFYVAVTSKGEVIVYQGTDPASSSTWALRGVWRVGSPVGSRCLYKFAGDLLLLSQDGILPLSSGLQSSRVNPRVALTDKIQSAISAMVSEYSSTFGWQMIYFARENQLWLNIPVAEGGQEQYAMNTITKAWCQYKGWGANCWEIFNDTPYFGGAGFVGKAWDTLSDNGANIDVQALQAFSMFGSQGRLKRFTMMRPLMRANGEISMLGSINIDFDTSVSTAPLTFAPTTYGLWGSATWGSSLWAGTLIPIQSWQGVIGIGHYGAAGLKTASKNVDVRWVSTDFVFEAGGIL